MIDQTFKTFIHDGLIPRYIDYTPRYLHLADTDSAVLDLADIFDVDADIEDVVKLANEIAADVNKTFPQFMEDVFNVQKEKCTITSDREIVAKSGLGLAKKRYIFRVLDNEGKREEKLKIMGLEIKKSDTPIIIQDFLRDIVDMLMDKKSYDEVKDFIDNFKVHYMKQDISVIGTPSNVKTLNKYSKKFEETNSFKGFPRNVKASMLYNSLRDTNDVSIRAGDKVKVVYIKERGEFNSVAIPSDLEIIPDFIKDIEIDWKKMWSTIEKKLEIYLKPIGYDKKSRQEEIVNQFVVY